MLSLPPSDQPQAHFKRRLVGGDDCLSDVIGTIDEALGGLFGLTRLEGTPASE